MHGKHYLLRPGPICVCIALTFYQILRIFYMICTGFPARTVCPKDSRLRGPEGARDEGNKLSQAKTAKPRQGGVHCVTRERAKAEVPDQEPQ